MADSARPPDLVPGDSAQPSNQPIDEEVRSGVLHDEDDAPYVIEQTNVGFGNMKGGGEWPDPDAPPEAPAPGSDPAQAAAIAAGRKQRRADNVARQDTTEKDPDDVARIADTHRGLAGEIDNSTPIKDILEADPERAGTKGTPD